jgi:SAM-dependent methyltransferase
MILKPQHDPIGNAAIDYYKHNDTTPIVVKSDVVEDEELLPVYFFRSFEEMPPLEKMALNLCKGRILDVGAGCGAHSLHLQNSGLDVTALEISELCSGLMRERSIEKVLNADIFDLKNQTFDTILLLMNGIGIAGTPDGLKKLLNHLKTLLSANGKIILDSSDLIYLYEQEDGSILFDLNADQYYGVINYKLKFKQITGKSFNWLFADQVLLADTAEEVGLHTRIIEYGEHYDYLAELSLKQ